MIKFHYFKQQPTKYMNQKFRFYFPFGSWRCGIGLLIARREFTVTWPPIISKKHLKTSTDQSYFVAEIPNGWIVREAHGEPDWSTYEYLSEDIIERLRIADFKWSFDKDIPDERLWIDAQKEIERLRTIIFNYYFEERKYQDQINDRVDPEFTIPQSWKDAYTAFEREAYSIESGY